MLFKHVTSQRVATRCRRFSLLWPHLLGRVQKETQAKAWTTIALNRCGSELEGGGQSPGTKQWTIAPGITTTVGGLQNKERAVCNNHHVVGLLQLLMDAYTLCGNFQHRNGHTYCTKAAAVE